MKYEFVYFVQSQWPKLSWVAELQKGRNEILIKCGSGLERRTRWFCEAVWDGPFDAGDFDKTDIVAGSGARMRGNGLTFVSSGSILDRLNYILLDDRTLVSNSLSALMAESGAAVDVTYPFYQQDFGTICSGLEEIKGSMATSQGDVRFQYFENLAWDGDRIRVDSKPRLRRDFSDFAGYQEFMQSTMNQVVRNARCGSRQAAVEPLVPLSNGYDSPAVAAMARQAGASDAFTIGSDREGNDDSGERIGKKLGMNVDVIGREDWREIKLAEVDCIAASGAAGEVAFLGMQDRLNNRLLLTGFWAGAIWGDKSKDSDRMFPMHDGSGLCFTELRLARGFIHCPVPFWGGLQNSEVIRLGRSDAMRAWSVGGRYDRPIPRRIVEQAGIPRQWFGTKKHGSSDQLLTAKNFLSESSRESYEAWLTRNAAKWFRKGRIPPTVMAGRLSDFWRESIFVPVLQAAAIPCVRRLALMSSSKLMWATVDNIRGWITRSEQTAISYRRHTFPWALEMSVRKYSSSPPGSQIVHGRPYQSPLGLDTASTGATRSIAAQSPVTETGTYRTIR